MSEQQGKILIDIHEKEQVLLDDSPASNLASIEAAGLLKVVNTSEQSRLWNLKLDVGETDKTNLPKNHEQKALEAGQEWELSYEIADPSSLLKVQEVVDVSKDTEHVDPYFVYGANDEAQITLTLTNVTDKDIQDIQVTKTIPKFLKVLEKGVVTAGTTEINKDEGVFTWTLDLLKAQDSASATFSGMTVVDTVDPRSAEPLHLTYKSEDAIHSRLAPSISALTHTMSGVETDESDQPGKWECEVEFLNESEFYITLNSAKVVTPIATGEETLVDLAPEAEISPDKSWTHEFLVDAPNVPKLNPSFEFTANHFVHRKITGRIDKPATVYTVLRCEVAKNIDPPTVDAYANTNMTITNTISNVGTAPVDTVKILDEIPEDFELPAPEDINCVIGDVKLDTTKIQISITGRVIEIAAKDLVAIFLPQKDLVVTFPLVARNPRPENTYATPLKVTSNTKPWGTLYSSEVSPEIGIRYVKRKIRTLKSVSPGAGEGEFMVKLRLRNKGDVELEKIRVRETMPAGFRITSFRPKNLVPAEQQEGDHTVLVWDIDRIDPDDDVRISYTTQGAGEYPRTEPQVDVGVEESDESSATGPASPATSASPPAAKDAPTNVGLLADIFNQIERKIQHGMLMHDVANEIEQLRDKLQEAGQSMVAIREIGMYAREIQKGENNSCVGDRQTEVLAKVAKWRQNLGA